MAQSNSTRYFGCIKSEYYSDKRNRKTRCYLPLERAVIITQCLGSGAKSAAKDMKHSLSWWGISKIEIFTGALMSDIVWEKLSRKKQAELTGKIQKLSRKFAHIDYTKPTSTNLITKFKFFFCRMMQKSIHKSDPEYLDGKYWAEQGWLGKNRPWRTQKM